MPSESAEHGRVDQDDVAIPDDFDAVVGAHYGRVLRPKELNEVGCHLATALEADDVSVRQAERILIQHNVVVLTPQTARQYAVEAVRLRRAEGPEPRPSARRCVAEPELRSAVTGGDSGAPLEPVKRSCTAGR